MINPAIAIYSIYSIGAIQFEEATLILLLVLLLLLLLLLFLR